MNPKPRATPPPPAPAFAALLAPFAALPEEKQNVLRDVLQIYVSKDSGKHTELEKRKRLTAVINDHVKGTRELLDAFCIQGESINGKMREGVIGMHKLLTDFLVGRTNAYE